MGERVTHQQSHSTDPWVLSGNLVFFSNPAGSAWVKTKTSWPRRFVAFLAAESFVSFVSFETSRFCRIKKTCQNGILYKKYIYSAILEGIEKLIPYIFLPGNSASLCPFWDGNVTLLDFRGFCVTSKLLGTKKGHFPAGSSPGLLILLDGIRRMVTHVCFF